MVKPIEQEFFKEQLKRWVPTKEQREEIVQAGLNAMPYGYCIADIVVDSKE